MITSILISHSEPQEFKELDFGVPSIVTQIDCDYLIGCSDGNTLAVERKEPNDLLMSIRDGRLFNQCHAMRKITEFCYIVVTGEILRMHNNKVSVGMFDTEWNYDSVQGSLLTVQELGVNVVYTADFRDAIIRLSKRNRDTLTIHPVRLSEPMSKAEALLCSLPAIGPTRAMELMAACGTAANALDWLTNPWQESSIKIRGLNWNQKCKIREVFGLDDGLYLTQNEWRNEDNA